MRTWLKAGLLLLVAFPAAAQSPLPAPTGSFKVGRSSHYVKGSPDLMLYVWYPADASAAGRPVPYIPGWPESEAALRAPLQRMFQGAFAAFEEGRIFSYAIDGAPISRAGGRFPVIVFAHGLGVPGFAYTAQMEELSSHGYVVAAVEYSPAAAFVLFPDARVASLDAELWNAIGKLPWDSPELIKLEPPQIEAGASALRNALDELARLDAAGPLSGRLDVSRAGVFGHSFGGMAAMRAAQSDRRFAAALTQDAISPSTLTFAAGSGRQMRAKAGLFFRPIAAQMRERVETLFTSYGPAPSSSRLPARTSRI